MPNWCENDLTISGPTEDVERLIAAVRPIDDFTAVPGRPIETSDEERSAFSLDRIVTMPAALRETVSPRDEPNDWYTWALGHWGTKWDVRARLVRDETRDGSRVLLYVFDSAWSPPHAAIAALAARYPTCAFSHEFHEGGNRFAGTYEYADGELQEREDRDYVEPCEDDNEGAVTDE